MAVEISGACNEERRLEKSDTHGADSGIDGQKKVAGNIFDEFA